MKFIYGFFFLLIIISCSHQNKIPLDQYVVQLHETEAPSSAKQTMEKCDTLNGTKFPTRQFLGVVSKDSVPVWISPTLKNQVGVLRFGDTIRIHAKVLSTCLPSQYIYKYYDKKQQKYYWAPGKFIVDLSAEAYGAASVYYLAAQNVGYGDTVSAKRFTGLIREQFPRDSIHFVVDGWDTTSYSADEAIIHLKANQYSYSGNYALQLKEQKKLLALIPDQKQKNSIALEIAYTINNLLTKPTSQDDVLECLRFLTTAITSFENEIVYYEEEGGNAWIDLTASDIIIRHFKKLASVSSESFILNLLEHSSNDAVVLKAAQLKATLAIQKNDFTSARQIILSFWKKYPAVTRNFYQDTEQTSLSPTAIAIDSLISLTNDYNKTLSFLRGLQRELTQKDSLLEGFLNVKAMQLSLESDQDIDSIHFHFKDYQFYKYPGTLANFHMNYFTISERMKLSSLIRNKVIIKSGAQLFNGLNGKNIRVTTKDIGGKILYEAMNKNYTWSVKIKCNEGIFWVVKSMISPAPEKLLLPLSREDNKPFLSQLLTLPYHYKHELRDINNDGTAELISYGSSESILDGATMQTLWKSPYANSNSIHSENNFYTILNLQLTKYSSNTTMQWTLSSTLPGYYGSIVPFLSNYDQSLYLFTTSGYLLEINDFNGEVKKTFRFDKSLSNYPVTDRTNLFFISDDYTTKSSTLHSLNLKARTFNWQIPLNPKDQNVMAIGDENRLFISKKNGVHALDRKTGNTIGTYIFKSDVRQFFSTDKQIIALTQQNLESINSRDTTSSEFNWVLSQQDIQSRPLLKDDVIYLCTPTELLFISANNGQIIQKLSLPSQVNSLAELTIYENRLLIPGERYLMIIENINSIKSLK